MADENNAVELAKKKLRQVQLVGPDGIKYQNVLLAPNASEVYVLPNMGTGTRASLQDFLFTKYKLKKVPVDENGAIVNPDSEDAVDTRIIQVIEDGDRYYEIDPSKTSVWQQWNDYQELLKKRLVGLYDDNGDYQGDFIKAIEQSIEANETLAENSAEGIPSSLTIDYAFVGEGENKEKKTNANGEPLYIVTKSDDTTIEMPIPNITAIINKYGLKDDYKVNSDGSQNNDKPITAIEQALALSIAFGSDSMWQTVIDNDQKTKDALWGIYNTDGQLVGHFEATANNIAQIIEVYKNIKYYTSSTEYSCIDTPEEAYNLLVDLSKKSIYQHLIDMRDFWQYLPIEYYGQDSSGNSIATKYDIDQIQFNNPWEVSE